MRFPHSWATFLAANLSSLGQYPNNNGTDDLLTAIGGYLNRRYDITVGASEILALNGTREGLYNAAMALCPETKNGQKPVILTPNPFYPVYAVAALSVNADPVFVPATVATGNLPDFAGLPSDILDRTAIAYICSPANP